MFADEVRVFIKWSLPTLYGDKFDINVVDLWTSSSPWPLCNMPKSYFWYPTCIVFVCFFSPRSSHQSGGRADAMSALAGPSAVLRRRDVGGTATSSDEPSSYSGAPLAPDTPRSKMDDGSDDNLDGAVATPSRHEDVKPGKVSSGKSATASFSTPVVSRSRVSMNSDPARLRVCAVTWNMCTRKFPEDLTPMLAALSGDDGTRCDILVVGVQEAPVLEGFVTSVLAALGGEDEFIHLAGVSLKPGDWIQMDVFVRRELLSMVRDVKLDAVSCGLGNVIGNKGGVGIAFEYAGARVCFINAHLAAHAENVAQRNADYHRIVKTMFAPRGREKAKYEKKATPMKSKKPKKVKGNAVAPAPAPAPAPAGPHEDDTGNDSPRDVTRPTPAGPKFGGVFQKKAWSAADGFDLCLFLGDLNYRVEGNRKAVDMLLQRGMLDVMRANDQLHIERTAGRTFPGWCEGTLSFPPTYKLNRGTKDTYDTSKKQRVPSWTDRVMWRTAGKGAVTCPAQADVYTSAKGILTSDHLPVVARIEARVEGARDAVPGDGVHTRPRLRTGMCIPI